MDMTMPGEGAVVLPDAMRMTLRGAGQGIEVIRIGTTRYQKSALFGDPNQWYVDEVETLGAENADPLALLRDLGALTGLTALPDEPVDGAPAEHYRAGIDPALFDRVGTRAIERSPMLTQLGLRPVNIKYQNTSLDLWVAKDTRYVVQQKLSLTVSFALEATAGGLPLGGSPPAQATPAPQPTPMTNTPVSPFTPLPPPRPPNHVPGAGMPGVGGGLAPQPGPLPTPIAVMSMQQESLMRYSHFNDPIAIEPPPDAIPFPAR